MRKVEPMISHMASYCCRYRFKMFCYYGIGAITIYAYTQMVFDETPGTCKYKYHIKTVLPYWDNE
jgi:hypothetical protein